MKGTTFIILSALALALAEEDAEIELNAVGCPVDFEVHLTLPHDTYCNLFYSCVNGNRVELSCPGTLVFNEDEGVCDWPINIECGSKGIYVPDSEEDEEESSNAGGNNDPSAAPEICAQENSDGVLVAHENCNQYFLCDRGVAVAFECQAGLLYNYNNGYCDWPFNVECGDRVIPAAK